MNLLWRAMRIVLDVGLHTRGMTPAEAVDYMVEHLPIERRSAEAEVRPLLRVAHVSALLCRGPPGGAAACARPTVRAAGGDYRSEPFHDALLGYGGLPVVARAMGDGPRGVREATVKITVLTYLDSEDENSKEYDPVVPQVARTLRRLGHRVSVLGVHGDVKRLIAGLSRRKPELVFNLMEMFGDNVFGDIPVAGAARAAAACRYTGSGPGELYLSQDKGLTKKLLAFEDILYPRFAVFSRQAALRDRRQPPHAAVRQAAARRRLDRHRRQVAGARRRRR